jgi:predicted  nucleic acid-binding Zn ribbon protein
VPRERLIGLIEEIQSLLDEHEFLSDEIENIFDIDSLDHCKKTLDTITQSEKYTHCPTCGVDMAVDASHIDWETIGFSNPCDDCCCGGCGSRKDYPGQEHC